jgi:uncharacterized membrane protein YebE (DUF533 family)
MKTIQKRAIELSENGCDWSEAKQILEKELKRPLTPRECEQLYTICGY